MKKRYSFIIFPISMYLFSGCSLTNNEQCLEVSATAYTSSKRETDSTPFLAAWKNQLKPGMKCIAVSRDLLPMGITNGTEVTIDGLEGKYKVLDKMNKRWEKKIDIYMGLNRKKALEWGRQSVTIRWTPKEEEEKRAFTLLDFAPEFSSEPNDMKTL